MMERTDAINERLPGLDCGSCGAPSCRALAEDIVQGQARLNDCIFILRQEASSAGIDISANLRHREVLPDPKEPGSAAEDSAQKG